MTIDRRELIVRAGMIGAAAPALLTAAAAQQPAAAQPSRADRLASAALNARQRLEYRDGTFSGPAWDMLLARGRDAQFFLLGEEHGIAENPKLAAALFQALVPSGYRNVAIEISPPMATVVDRALAEGGMDGFRRLFADEGARVAFFGLREEAEWLAAARAAVPGRQPLLWGFDYEVGADRHLIALLMAKRKPAAAATALAALQAASSASWARYHETRNPQYIYSFSGDPALVRAVRHAWPRPDAEAQAMLATLEETFEINRLWVAGRGFDSNVRRAAFLRGNFLRYWAQARRRQTPRVFMKFGASHMIRGLNPTDTFDIGALAPEVAAIEGGKSFHLLVLAGPDSDTSNFDPQAYTFRPGRREQYQGGMELIARQAWPDAFTLFDTAPLRPIARSNARDLHPELARAIHGFDAILVMSGSTPAANL